MDFTLSPEQGELAAMVRQLTERKSDSAAVRAAVETEAGYDTELWRTMCEQIGLAAMAIPEECGGAGFTFFETAVAFEELGRALTPSPLLAGVVAAELLLGLGETDGSPAAELLERIAAGQVATVAWAAGSGPASCVEPLVWDGTGVSGTVSAVLYGDRAEVVLAFARTDGSDEPVVLALDSEQVRRERTYGMDPTLGFATVICENTPATVLGGDPRAARHRAHRAGALACAAMAVGVAQRGLDLTVAYSGERVQFGRPIGSFQALKHRMAQMLVEVEVARSASWAGSYAHATGADDADLLAAVAKATCGDAVAAVAGETTQLHGGIAITWEHDAQLIFKRAHALNQLFGQPYEHRAAQAAMLLG